MQVRFSSEVYVGVRDDSKAPLDWFSRVVSPPRFGAVGMSVLESGRLTGVQGLLATRRPVACSVEGWGLGFEGHARTLAALAADLRGQVNQSISLYRDCVIASGELVKVEFQLAGDAAQVAGWEILVETRRVRGTFGAWRVDVTLAPVDSVFIAGTGVVLARSLGAFQ